MIGRFESAFGGLKLIGFVRGGSSQELSLASNELSVPVSKHMPSDIKKLPRSQVETSCQFCVDANVGYRFSIEVVLKDQ
jgi:hypothetical protein